MKATLLIFSDVKISKYAQRRTLQKAATLCSSVNLLYRERKSRKLQKYQRSLECPLRMSTIDDACREADFGIAWILERWAWMCIWTPKTSVEFTMIEGKQNAIRVP